MRVNILGFGITNKALVRLLNHYDIACDIYDDSFMHESRDSYGNAMYPFASAKDSNNIALISPGIAPNNIYLQRFSNIISEYDFIYSLLDSVYSIWISGTNGKTTTTQMASIMLHAKSGGNIGVPLAELFMQDFSHYNKDRFHNKILSMTNNSHSSAVFTIKDNAPVLWALETSSFSMHYSKYALPNLYILLPIGEDHITWHGGYDNYIYDKIKILYYMNLSSNPKKHFVLLPANIIEILDRLDSSKARESMQIIQDYKGNVYFYTDSMSLSKHFGIECSNRFKEPFLLDYMLASCGIKFAGMQPDIESMSEYNIDNYRMRESFINGILFINDSKATNPHAVLAALPNYADYEIYLILGGDAKGANMRELYEALKHYNVSIFSIGIDGENIYRDCLDYGIKAMYCQNLRAAMHQIYANINRDSSNNAIMLSPSCASLDQYKSYKDRGDEFDLLSKEIFS